MNLPTKIPSSLTTHMKFGINVMHDAWCLHPLRTYTSNDRGVGARLSLGMGQPDGKLR
jgi:hypothetical protein